MIEAKSGDQLLNLSHMNREFRKIAMLKHWQGYHTPKNLAAAVAVEASELLAEFQWLTTAESGQLTIDQKARVADEIADVVLYLTELSTCLGINMVDAIQAKIDKNHQRFTAE